LPLKIPLKKLHLFSLNQNPQPTVKNPKALKLIDKILDDLDRNGIITNTMVKD
jgi:hypothetical protein